MTWIGKPEPYDDRPPLWDELEGIVGHKVTDANLGDGTYASAALALQKHYDDFMASRRTEPQVLIRPGIGQVLAVGGVPVR